MGLGSVAAALWCRRCSLGYPCGGGHRDGGGKGAADCPHPLPRLGCGRSLEGKSPALFAPAGGQSPQVKGRCGQLEFGLWEGAGQGTASECLTLTAGFSFKAGIKCFL